MSFGNPPGGGGPFGPGGGGPFGPPSGFGGPPSGPNAGGGPLGGPPATGSQGGFNPIPGATDPNAQGGAFGAPSSGGAFGAPPSGGAFGAPPGAAFGGPPATGSQGGFNPVPGASDPNAQGGAFGAPPSGGAFGAPPGGAFGAPQGGAFGAPPSGGAFGAPPGGAFGAPPGSAFGAPPGGAFGAPQGGAFGGVPVAPPTAKSNTTAIFGAVAAVVFLGVCGVGMAMSRANRRTRVQPYYTNTSTNTYQNSYVPPTQYPQPVYVPQVPTFITNSGMRSMAEVSANLATRAALFRSCAMSDPSARSQMAVRFMIGSNGRVLTSMGQPGSGSFTVDNCVNTMVRGMVFSPSSGFSIVVHPISLR